MIAMNWLEAFIAGRTDHVDRLIAEDPRVRASIRGEKAMWGLIREKLNEADFKEVRKVHLTLEPLLFAGQWVTQHAAYLQGMQDGLNLASASPKDSFCEVLHTRADTSPGNQDAYTLMDTLLKEYGDIEEVF